MANASFSLVRENTVDSKLDHYSGEQSEVHQAPILVLSRYSALIETVRKAAPRGVRVVQVPDVDQAAAKARSLSSGVLVVDTASTADLAGLVAELAADFPALVIVAAGQRDDGVGLMPLTASGQVFRFLLVPLSHGQTRLTLEAAITEHKKLVAPAPPMDEPRAPNEGVKPREATGYVGYAALAAGLAIAIGGIGWFASRTASEPEAPVAAAPTHAAGATAPPSTAASRPDPLQVELTLAQAAFARGEYVEPAGTSALDYYRSALSIDPESRNARDGIRRVADKILERAESALTERKVEDAVTAIGIARDVDPQHPRLAFLDALAASGRIEQDADRRITELVAKAQGLMNQSFLVAPKGGSARDALLEARRLDPTNPAVAQGLRDLSQALAEEAKRMLDAGNSSEAQALASSARQLGFDGASLSAVESALTEARNKTAAKRPPTPLEKASPAPALAAIPTNVASVPPRATEPARTEISESAPTPASKVNDSPQQPLAAARAEVAPGKEAAEREPPAEARANTAATGDANSIVPVAQLRRVRTVEPVYPIAARRRKETGMVEVVFTVTPNGSVENVEVRKSTPELVFDDAAKKAVEQWRFDPVKVNGQAVSQRAFARLRFSLD